MSTNEQSVEMISREVGERVLITGGRDYSPPTARIIISSYKSAGENEKAIYINQGKNAGVSLSLDTLKAIIEWAKGETSA